MDIFERINEARIQFEVRTGSLVCVPIFNPVQLAIDIRTFKMVYKMDKGLKVWNIFLAT